MWRKEGKERVKEKYRLREVRVRIEREREREREREESPLVSPSSLGTVLEEPEFESLPPF